jgi:hypothetical protein
MFIKYDIVNTKYNNIINDLHYRILKEDMFKTYSSTQLTFPSIIQSVSIEYDVVENTVDINSNLLTQIMCNGKHSELTNCMLYTNFSNIHSNSYVVNNLIEPVYLQQIQFYHLTNIFNLLNHYCNELIFNMTYYEKNFFLNKLKLIYIENVQKYYNLSRDLIILNLMNNLYSYSNTDKLKVISS